ncbi:MAG: hypothetical protein GX049_12410 [Alcaligenaceae bacterium]|nr:hypothetical protein [Alcaligenaceae bacterium]
MSTPVAWFITVEDTHTPASRAAGQLGPYGLTVKGQRWPENQSLGWLVSAQEAASAQAGVVVVAVSAVQWANPELRRSLALFRLALQTLRQRWINGFILLTGDSSKAATDQPDTTTFTTLLNDWTPLEGSTWPARVVARAHAPVAPKWPVRLNLHGHERLGVWLETHPVPLESSRGALVGVSGNQASIGFHAVGPKGRLPDRSINEYELKGLQFQAGNHDFTAWALQNPLAPDQSYFVRLDGEPDFLAVGSLPEGSPDDVSLIALR